MYGLISKIKANAAQRETLIAVLLDASARAMPGCLHYVVARDASDADGVWVTEIWDSRASHRASLSLPAVQQTIAKGRPLIAGFEERFETEPAGGHGLA
jgi:quinol monooxygenase YgiN